jgi:hypothetical protein
MIWSVSMFEDGMTAVRERKVLIGSIVILNRSSVRVDR